jgi:anhydro-N-acetylmuramic acid kinase
VERILAWARRHHASAEDLVRTATVFTALSIADALNRWVVQRTPISQLLVSGGGARNPLILAQLSAALAPIEVTTTESLGLPGDAKEAFIFALLADQTLHGRPSNLPSATGARRPAILGKICYPPPR